MHQQSFYHPPQDQNCLNRLVSWTDTLADHLCGFLDQLWGMIIPDPALAGYGEVPVLPTRKFSTGNRLCNSGGPRSRTREQRIYASAFGDKSGRDSCPGVRQVGGFWSISCDKSERNLFTKGETLRDIAFEVLKSLGFATPEGAYKKLKDIPRSRLHSRPLPLSDNGYQTPSPWLDSEAFLCTALVLGKCCNSLYDPDRPIIWTEHRLEQRLALYEIRQPFYADSE